MFDINKREFVVVRQTGQGKSVLMSRLPEKAPLAQTAMRTHRAVVVSDAAADERVSSDERWRTIGVDVASLVCAPVMVGGRYLGLLELANPLDGDTFSDGDGHALTYIGEQFGEFVAQHGVVIDPEHVLAAGESAGGGKSGKGARR
jgi:GAF domain-containing protein